VLIIIAEAQLLPRMEPEKRELAAPSAQAVLAGDQEVPEALAGDAAMQPGGRRASADEWGSYIYFRGEYP